MDQYFLGIEIGGSKLQAAVGVDGGEFADSTVVEPVVPELGAHAILKQLHGLVAKSLIQSGRSLSDLSGIGVGFGGPVLAKQGVVVESHQVHGWKDFPLAHWMRDQFQLPTVLGNDSDLAGWAEALFGAGKGFESVVYMNIGSGIGGAFVYRGELYQGAGFGAAEIGHLRFAMEADNEWPRLEDVASGFALDAIAKQLHEPPGIGDARWLATAARNGHFKALEAWNKASERWALAIANVVTLLCPNRIVLGGGVANEGDFLFEPLRRQVRRTVFAPFADRFEIVPAALKDEVVVHGSLRLAKQAFGSS